MGTSKRQIIIISVIALFIILLIGVGAYVYAQNKQVQVTKSTVSQATSTVQIASSSMIGWKVYKNSAYGLSFKYPPTVTVVQDSSKITLKDSKGNTVANINQYREYFNKKCTTQSGYELGTQKIPGSKEICDISNAKHTNYIIPLKAGGVIRISSVNTTLGPNIVDDIIRTIDVYSYDIKKITFVSPAQNVTVSRGNSFLVAWNGLYTSPLVLKVESTAIDSQVSSIINNHVLSLKKENQIMWEVPCNFDNSKNYFRLVLTDKSTGAIIAKSMAFFLSNKYNESKKCLSASSSSTAPTTKSALPIINSINPSSVSIGSNVSIVGNNFNWVMPVWCRANGCANQPQISVLLLGKTFKSAILFEGKNSKSSKQITVKINPYLCTSSQMSGLPCDAVKIIPGRYTVIVIAEGRGTSNSFPITITK